MFYVFIVYLKVDKYNIKSIAHITQGDRPVYWLHVLFGLTARTANVRCTAAHSPVRDDDADRCVCLIRQFLSG